MFIGAGVSGELVKWKKDYEYYMGLDNFILLKKPMSASKMKKTTNQGFPFRTTMFSISDECKDDMVREIMNTHI